MSVGRGCDTEEHADREAVAVLLYEGKTWYWGEGLCARCAECIDCGARAEVMDAVYTDEAYCKQCVPHYPESERPDGREVVTIDSPRWRELVASMESKS